ncbi:hypothetical protein ACSSS7_007013 [Eimeria intestinalis]
MAVCKSLLAELLAAFTWFAFGGRSVYAFDLDKTQQQTAEAWETDTRTGTLSDVSLAEVPTEDVSLTVSGGEPAFREPAGAAAEGARVDDVASKRIGERRYTSSFSKGVLFASAAILLMWMAASRIRGKRQVVETKKAEPHVPVALPPINYEPAELHQLAAAANRVSALLGGSGLESAAAEVSRRVQEVERCYTITQDLANRKKADEVELRKASERFNEELQTLLNSTYGFLKHAMDPVEDLKEEVSREAAELGLEADAANQVAKAAPHDFALAQKALTGKFASGALETVTKMDSYVNAFAETAAFPPTSLKSATTAVRRLMTNVSHMRQLSSRVLEDSGAADSWRRSSDAISLKALRVEGATLCANLRVIADEVAPKHMTEAAAAAASKHQETLEKLNQILKQAPSEADLARANQAVLLRMLEKLKTANQRAREEADSVLEDIRAELKDQSLYNEDHETLKHFREQAVLMGSLSADSGRATIELVNAMSRAAADPHPQSERNVARAASHASQAAQLAKEAEVYARSVTEARSVADAMMRLKDLREVQLRLFAEGRRAEEVALSKVAWDHLAGIASETLSSIDGMCNTIMKTEILSFQINAAKQLHHARALVEEIKRTANMKTATQRALELRCIYNELAQTMTLCMNLVIP